MALESLIEELEREKPSFRDIFPPEDKNLDKISKLPEGADRLKKISDFADYLSDKGFSPTDCFLIAKGRDYPTKLRWIKGYYESDFEQLGFSPSNISKVMTNKRWHEAFEWISEKYESTFSPLGFTQSHISEIASSKDFDEKFRWISRHYEDNLNPMGFEPSHVLKMMKNKRWNEALDWILDEYEEILKPLGFNPSNVSKIVDSKDFDKKIGLITEYYNDYLRPWGFSPADVTWIMSSKDWKERFDNIIEKYSSFKKNRLFQKAAPYLKSLVTRKYDLSYISALVENYSHESVKRFEEDVYSISGVHKAETAKEVYDELNSNFGYSSEEVNLNLKIINKGSKGLLRWYNEGRKAGSNRSFKLRDLRFEDHAYGRPILEKIPSEVQTPLNIMEDKESIDSVYKALADAQPHKKDFWNNFIYECGCDPESLSTNEKKVFESSLNELKDNKTLMLDIYCELSGSRSGKYSGVVNEP
ncbi:MAG: hypothetical protein ACQEP1_03270 [Nanobdellota archaeon]